MAWMLNSLFVAQGRADAISERGGERGSASRPTGSFAQRQTAHWRFMPVFIRESDA
jgi:hypothetical protein